VGHSAAPPARSPDLNCIENLFSEADDELDKMWWKKRPKDASETKRRFKEVCAKIAEAGGVRKLVGSMPKRMQAVEDAGGGPIDY
jgi:hypothetical protein